MEKVRFTKGELKRQRDALRQYQRYLPTLQLKKQQLQIEILQETVSLEEKLRSESTKTKSAESWVGLLTDKSISLNPWIKPKRVLTKARNIAGVDVPVFETVELDTAEYDLFTTPLWVDAALEALRSLVSLREEIKVIEQGLKILKQELRTTAQRVNLFEKVKIPEAEEAIRRIKIYISDQMANAVGRSKAAKRKIEMLQLTEAFA